MVNHESDSEPSSDSDDSSQNSFKSTSTSSAKKSDNCDIWSLAARMRQKATGERMTGVSKPRKRRCQTSRSPSPPSKKAQKTSLVPKQNHHRLSLRLAYLWMKGEKKNTLGLHTQVLDLSSSDWYSDLLVHFYEQFRTDAEERFPPLELQTRSKNPLPPLPPFDIRWVKFGLGIAPFEGKSDFEAYLQRCLDRGGVHHAKDVTVIFQTHRYLEDIAATESARQSQVSTPQEYLKTLAEELESQYQEG